MYLQYFFLPTNMPTAVQTLGVLYLTMLLKESFPLRAVRKWDGKTPVSACQSQCHWRKHENAFVRWVCFFNCHTLHGIWRIGIVCVAHYRMHNLFPCFQNLQPIGMRPFITLPSCIFFFLLKKPSVLLGLVLRTPTQKRELRKDNIIVFTIQAIPSVHNWLIIKSCIPVKKGYPAKQTQTGCWFIVCSWTELMWKTSLVTLLPNWLHFWGSDFPENGLASISYMLSFRIRKLLYNCIK